MASLYNLARMSTATTGTGTITLGSAVTGFLSFASAGVSNGDSVTYAIQDGSNSEIGRGTYTASGTTLTRSVLKSTNAGAALNLSGTAQVFITPAAEDFTDITAAIATAVQAIAPNFQIFTASGSFAKSGLPTNVTHVIVEVVGGGGGCGGANSSTSKRGTGGGGGGYALKRIAVSALGASETVTIGAGGTAGTTSGSPTNGGTGGTTSFGAHVSATGGGGGSAATGSAMGGPSGGSGSGGDINIGGEAGLLNDDGGASSVSYGGNAGGGYGCGFKSNIGGAGGLYGGGAACANHSGGGLAGAAGICVVWW